MGYATLHQDSTHLPICQGHARTKVLSQWLPQSFSLRMGRYFSPSLSRTFNRDSNLCQDSCNWPKTSESSWTQHWPNDSTAAWLYMQHILSTLWSVLHFRIFGVLFCLFSIFVAWPQDFVSCSVLFWFLLLLGCKAELFLDFRISSHCPKMSSRALGSRNFSSGPATRQAAIRPWSRAHVQLHWPTAPCTEQSHRSKWLL